MSVCEHDPHCPGYGLVHEAGLTPEERISLGLPLGKDLSNAKVRRLIRRSIKEMRLAEQ